MIEYGRENKGREFLLSLLLANLEGKTADEFVDEWLRGKEPPAPEDYLRAFFPANQATTDAAS